MSTVRPARAEDAGALLSVHVAAIRAFGPAAYDDEQVAAWAVRPDGASSYRESVECDAEHVLVAEQDGEVVGFAGLDVGGAEVSAVYVHPDHARDGLGTALLQRLEARARREGLGELSLWASLNAVGFYERRGYEPVGPVVHRTTGGVELPCLEMAKRLDR